MTENQKKLYDIFFWADPVDLQEQDAASLKQRLREYQEACYTLNIIPTLSDMAVAMSIPRQTLQAYRDGIVKCPREVRETLKRASRWMEAVLAQVGFNNAMYSTYIIWLQKNYFGFKDNIEINVSQNQLTDEQSAQDVMQRYKYIEASVVVPELEDKAKQSSFVDALQKPQTLETEAIEETLTNDDKTSQN